MILVDGLEGDRGGCPEGHGQEQGDVLEPRDHDALRIGRGLIELETALVEGTSAGARVGQAYAAHTAAMTRGVTTATASARLRLTWRRRAMSARRRLPLRSCMGRD